MILSDFEMLFELFSLTVVPRRRAWPGRRGRRSSGCAPRRPWPPRGPRGSASAAASGSFRSLFPTKSHQNSPKSHPKVTERSPKGHLKITEVHRFSLVFARFPSSKLSFPSPLPTRDRFTSKKWPKWFVATVTSKPSSVKLASFWSWPPKTRSQSQFKETKHKWTKTHL